MKEKNHLPIFFQIKKKLFILTILAFAASIYAQNPFPEGLSLAYGFGQYSVRDEYISQEKYAGNLPHFSAGWSKFHRDYGYRLQFEYAASGKIKNHRISTNVTRLVFNQGFFYPLAVKPFFNKDFYSFWGPATELYFFYNDQNVAVSGFDFSQSFAALFSVGLNYQAVLPMNETWQVEAPFSLSVLSLGFRMVDSEEDDTSPAKLLTLFSGTHASFGLGIRQKFTANLSWKLAYQLRITRISAWKPLLAATDSFAVSATIQF